MKESSVLTNKKLNKFFSDCMKVDRSLLDKLCFDFFGMIPTTRGSFESKVEFLNSEQKRKFFDHLEETKYLVLFYAKIHVLREQENLALRQKQEQELEEKRQLALRVRERKKSLLKECALKRLSSLEEDIVLITDTTKESGVVYAIFREAGSYSDHLLVSEGHFISKKRCYQKLLELLSEAYETTGILKLDEPAYIDPETKQYVNFLESPAAEQFFVEEIKIEDLDVLNEIFKVV